MSDIRRNRLNLLNNDWFRTTSALTGIFSVLGKSLTGVRCGRARKSDTAASVRCRTFSGWGREGDDPAGS
jgi:hypothetical protein